MARRTREYTRIRKRIFVVSGITLTVVALVAAFLSWLLSTLVGPSNLYRFSIAEERSRPAVLGSGLSLSDGQSASFLRDSSFEPFVFRHAVSLLGGSGRTLLASSEDASAGLYGDGFFNGASARILSMGREGLTLRKTASVVRFGINRVGVFQTLALPADVPAGAPVLAFARSGSRSLAVGRSGLVLRNVAGQTIVSGNSGITADLTGVCSLGEGFLSVSAAGDAAYSTDGAAWQPWTVGAPAALTAVTAAEPGLVVAVGRDGAILVGSSGFLNPVASGTTRTLRSVAYGNGRFVAAGDGVLLQSGNGLVWEPVTDPRAAVLADTTSWQSVSFQAGRFLVTGSGGQVALSDGSSFTFQTIDPAQVYLDAVMLSGQQIILLDAGGHFSVSNDQGLSWQKSGIDTGMSSRIIELIGKDKILSADAEGHLGQASIVAEIELDSPVAGQALQSGDLCFLETFRSDVPATYLGKGAALARENMPWQVQGNGTAERVAGEAAPSGGSGALRLTALAPKQVDGQDETFISQVVNPALLLSQSRTQVYRLELYMRQDQLASRAVMAWISGPFTSVGTTFENVGSTYKKYTFTFVLPLESIRETSEIRLNIGFRGTGTVLLDRVYFGPATDLHHGLDRRFAESVTGAAPGFIRLAYAGIGSESAADAFALPIDSANPTIDEAGFHDGGIQSLDTGLQLCLEADASPYLVIGSQMSQASLQNLLEFLCGPVSEPYGQLRLANGRVAPYSDAFDRIIIEFNDDAGLFASDQQRASFVNTMMRTVEQSSYYRELKSRLVFVDGMSYQDGVLLSRADYHATDFSAVIGTAVEPAISAAFLKYFDQIPRTPERSEERYPEIMRQTVFRLTTDSQPRLPDICGVLLQDLGKYTSLACLDYPLAAPAQRRQLYLAAAGIVSRAAHGVPLVSAVLADSDNRNAAAGAPTSGTAAVSATVTANAGSDATAGTGTDATAGTGTPAALPVSLYAFRDGNGLSVILMNSGTEPVILQLSTELPLVPATIAKYDAKGQLLSTQPLRRLNSRINLLPGSVALIQSDKSAAR